MTGRGVAAKSAYVLLTTGTDAWANAWTFCVSPHLHPKHVLDMAVPFVLPVWLPFSGSLGFLLPGCLPGCGRGLSTCLHCSASRQADACLLDVWDIPHAPATLPAPEHSACGEGSPGTATCLSCFHWKTPPTYTCCHFFCETPRFASFGDGFSLRACCSVLLRRRTRSSPYPPIAPPKLNHHLLLDKPSNITLPGPQSGQDVRCLLGRAFTNGR